MSRITGYDRRSNSYTQ